MIYRFIWILLLIYSCAPVLAHPTHGQEERNKLSQDDLTYNEEYTTEGGDEKVISVRITSSIAVGRSQKKLNRSDVADEELNKKNFVSGISEINKSQFSSTTANQADDTELSSLPAELAGANIEFIKQLKAKKGVRDLNLEQVHPFELLNKNEPQTGDEPVTDDRTYETDDDTDGIPLARKIASPEYVNKFNNIKKSMDQHILLDSTQVSYVERENDDTASDLSKINDEGFPQNMTFKSLFSLNTQDIVDSNLTNFENNYNQTEDTIAEPSIHSTVEVNKNKEVNRDTVSEQNYFGTAKKNTGRLTTVSFNVVHDTPQNALNNDGLSINREQQVVSNLPRVYSEPARIYSEPAKFYSEPAKIYSEPAKIYSEPAKVYSEPSKVYSEPAKFYSQPASLHINPSVPPTFSTWQHPSQSAIPGTTAMNTTPLSPIGSSRGFMNVQRFNEHQPEKNYEIDEKTSIMTNGRSHGVQETTTEKCKQDNCKVGYVVEGRQFKKYRVEERTSDGFIVGEYGVVRNEDGALRGVRYTADSEASPRLIYDALMKFLQLK